MVGRGWKCLADSSADSRRHLKLPLPTLFLTLNYTREETQTPLRKRYDCGHVTSVNMETSITLKSVVVRMAVPGT